MIVDIGGLGMGTFWAVRLLRILAGRVAHSLTVTQFKSQLQGLL